MLEHPERIDRLQARIIAEQRLIQRADKATSQTVQTRQPENDFSGPFVFNNDHLLFMVAYAHNDPVLFQ